MQINDDQPAGLGRELEILGESMEMALNEAHKHEDTYRHEAGALTAELKARERVIADLNEKIKTHQREKENLVRELAEKANEFRAQLERERGDLKTLYEKKQRELAEQENQLVNERREFEAKADPLSKEIGRLNAELHNLNARHEALKEGRQALLKKIEELGAANDGLVLSFKDKEEAHKLAGAAERLELSCRQHEITALEKELEKKEQDQQQSAGKFAQELQNKAEEFRAALANERGNFKAAYQKLEQEAAAGEKELLAELQALKEGASRKDAELNRLNLELKSARDKQDILKKEFTESAARAEGLGAELKEQRALANSSLSALAEKEEALLRARGELEKSEAKSLKSLEQLAEKNERLAKLDKELETLKDNTEKAERAESMREEVYRHERQKLAMDLAAKDQLIAELKKELLEATGEKEKSRLELLSRSAQFKALQDKENKEAGLAYEKMEREFLEREAEFFTEAKKFKETLSHKCLEMDKLTGEAREAKESRDDLMRRLEAAMTELAEQNIFSRSARSALKEKEEELTALRAALKQAEGKQGGQP